MFHFHASGSGFNSGSEFILPNKVDLNITSKIRLRNFVMQIVNISLLCSSRFYDVTILSGRPCCDSLRIELSPISHDSFKRRIHRIIWLPFCFQVICENVLFLARLGERVVSLSEACDKCPTVWSRLSGCLSVAFNLFILRSLLVSWIRNNIGQLYHHDRSVCFAILSCSLTELVVSNYTYDDTYDYFRCFKLCIVCEGYKSDCAWLLGRVNCTILMFNGTVIILWEKWIVRSVSSVL